MTVLKQLQKLLKPIIQALSVICIILSGSGSAFSLSGEMLIIVLQDTGNPVEDHFKQSLLPGIRTVASDLGVELDVLTGNAALPEEVGITPLVVYQNHRGRSIYQGRTTTLDRIKNFIRTSRRIPQGKREYTMTDTPVWKKGRAFVWAPLKVSPLGGTQPENHADSTFQNTVLTSIKQGFSQFKTKQSVSAGRSDRGFYMDFYPWLSDDGTLYLSLALFSQFHCKKPVFEHKLTGPWDERDRLFKTAARIMEKEVEKQCSDPEGGDGFVSVPGNTRLISWKKLGYPLPPPPPSTSGKSLTDISLPRRWQVIRPTQDELPLIQFRFPPPLDSYSGEASHVTGWLSFPEDMTIQNLKGKIQVNTFSITMGENDLDSTIKGSLFLDSESYNYSEFIITGASSRETTLTFGQMTVADIRGTFRLKGKDLSMSLPVSFEPVIGGTNTPVLMASGSFSIDLRHFDIEGATGPEPEKYTLLFDLNLMFNASPASVTRTSPAP